ncbi:hypothetical protein AMS68_004711 [Peltaster fructicola]|uniref:Protein kinase domain-containing protein n=1 Tax=Peltaster fructicola TaxID=286661 RepID=A0A6H0XWU0_9PEZI|nr:hypothetical protein AMS68_004711 [Peltaster fructicola]
MSRFFRSADSDSSNSNDSDSDDGAELQESQLIIRESPPASVPDATFDDTELGSRARHQDLLLHALLEERCLYQARDQLGEATSTYRVQQHAQEQYQSLSQRLAAYGVIAPGLNHAAFVTRRQAVRDGLDALSRTQTSGQITSTELVSRRGGDLQPSMQQLEMGIEAPQLFRQQVELPQLMDLPQPRNIHDALLTMNNRSPTTTTAAFFNGSRYQREFEEVCTLGRGGYGIVYQCKHRFDGLSYAVKKVPLSTGRLQRIRDRGQTEIDRLLLELTTLARLDHPNIVRYFGGWVEYATLRQHNLGLSNEDATFDTSKHTTRSVSTSRTNARFAEVADDFICFEPSTSHGTTTTMQDTSDSADTLQRQSTRNTQATVSDTDVESIDRSVSASVEYSTLSDFVDDTSPCLALHIQMGLYPMTLTDYIASTSTSKHCFHVEPSVRILSALVDGIVYLHSQGVVHRDLKPANVFLSEQQHKHGWCRQCSPVNYEGLKIRIGDFGLVAALAQKESDNMTIPVGTELYRPHSAIDRSGLEALDWFALGIMAFELLWPFSTRMERHETLSALKAGVYPLGFAQRMGDHTDDVMALVEYLLRSHHPVGLEELQAMLAACN